MKIFKAIIMSIGIAAAAMTASAQNDGFRLKWAENDGTEWYSEENAIFTLVSTNSHSDTENQYAKILAFPSESDAVVVAVQGMDLTQEVSFIIIDNGKRLGFLPKSYRDAQRHYTARYADMTKATNAIMKKIGTKATCFSLEKDALPHISESNSFTVRLIDDDNKEIEYTFTTARTLAELLEK